MKRKQGYAPVQSAEHFMELPMLLNVGQVALLLNVSDRQAQRLCERGELKACKVGQV